MKIVTEKYENPKKGNFLALWRGSKTLIFDVFSAKLSLQSAVMLRNLVWNTCSGFLKNCLNSKISVSKKIRVIRHVQVKIVTEKYEDPLKKILFGLLERVENSDFFDFFGKSFISKRCRVAKPHVGHMFRVSKTLSKLITICQ